MGWTTPEGVLIAAMQARSQEPDYATATPEESTESLLGKLSTRCLTAEQATKLQALVKSGIENTRQMLVSDVGRCERDLAKANKALDAFNKEHQ